MTITIGEIIKGTPYWAWLFLAYFIYVGIQALKERVVSIFRLSLMPILFILWSIFSLYSKTTFSLILYPFIWIIGMIFGRIFMDKFAITIDKHSKLIRLPGSIIPLILSSSFFFIKYCLGVSYALYPEFSANLLVTGFDAIASGLFSGFSFGRFSQIAERYYKEIYKK